MSDASVWGALQDAAIGNDYEEGLPAELVGFDSREVRGVRGTLQRVVLLRFAVDRADIHDAIRLNTTWRLVEDR